MSTIKPKAKQILKAERIQPDPESAFAIEVPTRVLPLEMVEKLKRALRKAYAEDQKGNTGAVLAQIKLFLKDDEDEETFCIRGQFFGYSVAMQIFKELKKGS